MNNKTKNQALMAAVWCVAMVGVGTCNIALALGRIDRLPRLRATLTHFNRWVAVRVYMMVQYQRMFAYAHTGEE